MTDISPESRDYSFDQIEDDPRLKRTSKEFFLTLCVYIIYGFLMISNLFIFGQHSTIDAADCETLTVIKELRHAEKTMNQAAAELKKSTKDNLETAEKNLEAAKQNLKTAEEKVMASKRAYEMEICSMPSVHTTKPFGLPLWIFNLICLLIGMVVTVELVCKFGYKDMPLTDEKTKQEAD